MNFGIIPASFAPYMLSLSRIVVGLLFMEHGTGKILNFPPIHEASAKVLGSGLLYFTGTIELVGGALIVLGLFTRPVAFVLAGFMAYAFWGVHYMMGGLYPVLNGGEAAVLYCFAFLYYATAGAGPISVDALAGSPSGSASPALTRN
jgi:putative oxidoreductase